jgi:glycine/D-amino acid oxidase-like deaminating enzyme
MTRVLVVGGGVAGLLTAQLLLDRADDLAASHDPRAEPVDLTLAVHRPGEQTASRSGGLALRYASSDPRGDRWTARSGVLAHALAARHAHLRPHVRSGRALLVSRRAPVLGYPGRALEPAEVGLTAHAYGLEHEASPQWDPCALLPRWPAALAADPRVRVVALPQRVTSFGDLGALHDEHRADVTVACLGLGAHALGDRALTGRLGVLVSGPLPTGTVHAERAVVDDDDPLYPRYTVPHGDHLHLGGTYLPVDDAADWDDPARLAAVAHAQVPALLAAAAERFPSLAGWQPTGGPWWGIRPVRELVALGRVDPGLVGGRDVVVSHGWGGSGWTIGPAVAEETARSLLPGAEDRFPDPLTGYGAWRP